MCLFHKALRKWGTTDDVWQHEILEVMTTLAGIKRAEKLWIVHRQTFAYDEGNLGYNETRGGDGILGLKHSQETKNRLRLINTGENHPMFGKPGANRGRKFSLETRLKMRIARLGKKRSIESLIKQSKTLTGRSHTQERIENIRRNKKNKRAIEQLTLDRNHSRNFESISEACRSLNLTSATSITNCCKQLTKQAYGFVWRYKNK